jgi:hypothetical protein
MAVHSLYDDDTPQSFLTFDELGQGDRWESVYLQRRAKDEERYRNREPTREARTPADAAYVEPLQTDDVSPELDSRPADPDLLDGRPEGDHSARPRDVPRKANLRYNLKAAAQRRKDKRRGTR